MTRSRADENLTFWRGLHGLDPAFPSLTQLRDDELLESVVIDETQLDIIRSSVAGDQLTQIVVQPGWGGTTLFRYVLQDARARVRDRLMLPVSIDLRELFLDRITPEALTREIRLQIMALLLDSPWETVLGYDFYFECINYDSVSPLGEHKKEALRFLFRGERPSDRRLAQRFPWLRDPLSAQLGYLLANLRIQTGLYVHVPTDTSAERIRDLLAALKWITRDLGHLHAAAWREIYFCTPSASTQMLHEWKRPFRIIQYEPYTAAQFYLMLIRRYEPSSASAKRAQLPDIFPSELVFEAYRGGESLTGLSDLVRSAVLRRLDCPKELVPFTLRPHTTPDGIGSSESGESARPHPPGVASGLSDAQPPRSEGRHARTKPLQLPAHELDRRDGTPNVFAVAGNARPTMLVFLCHSSGDKPRVRRLDRRLRAAGVDTWLDERSLVAGQEWDDAIRQAVRKADAVLVCLSRDSVSKTGYIQKEIRDVLDVADEQPEGARFLIPVRLEECDVPGRLSRWHWVDLYKPGSFQRLLVALRPDPST